MQYRTTGYATNQVTGLHHWLALFERVLGRRELFKLEDDFGRKQHQTVAPFSIAMDRSNHLPWKQTKDH